MSAWDAALLELDETALVRIGRERRLVLEDGDGPQRVDLCWVDEVVLALIDLADARRRDLTIVYPAPAGQVAVLLAAQLLLRQFVEGNHASSVGIVTADTSTAARTWNALRIATTGDRPRVADVFPCFRARPDGLSPGGARRLQGVVIGQACRSWNVDHLIVDRLAGPAQFETDRTLVEVVADPTDPALGVTEQSGRAMWGWSEASLASGSGLERRLDHTVPFSVASDRLETLAGGVSVRVDVARHPAAEEAVARVREDLRLLRSLSPRRADRNVERGLSIAWHHLATLISLPCRPSRFDAFSGLPPIAARPTRDFANELASWAVTLDADRSEIASVLASDLADARAALELGNPLEEMLSELRLEGGEAVVVTRTKTASKALRETLGAPTTLREVGPLTITHVGDLHRRGTWPRAVFVGEPSPWDWHRILGGLAPVVDVFTIGYQSAQNCARQVETMRRARDHWGSEEVRARAWSQIVGGPTPPTSGEAARRDTPPLVVDGAEYVPQGDPFEPLSALFDLDPLDIGGEGPTGTAARQDEVGDWSALVSVYEVLTDQGRLLLEVGKAVDARDGPKIVELTPEQLKPGAVLLIGRREGRVGLLEALEVQLGHRPDLLAARYLLDEYHRLVRTRWEASGLTLTALHRKMANLGCGRTLAAVRSWVTESTMAPQHLQDLRYLDVALGLGMSDLHMHEVFAGVQRRRGFRRAAGRALAAAARDSTVAVDDARIDADTGLTVADLRDAVVEATVVSVARCEQPVPITLVGTLEVL